VTLAKVAENAGVSITTVSVVLSGHEGNLKQFHPDTIAKVRQTAERLGYCANLFASGLPSNAPPFFAMVIRWAVGCFLVLAPPLPVNWRHLMGRRTANHDIR